MNTYQITKGSWSCLKNFPSLEDAQIFADSLGTGYVAELSSEQMPEPTKKELYQNDKQFCDDMIEDLILYNRESLPLSKQDAKTQRNKFDDIYKDLDRCDLELLLEDLQDLAIDAYYSEEKRDELVLLITNYTAQ